MKKLLCMLMICSFTFSLSACGGMSVSNKMYNEISDYVTENLDSFSPAEENEFYDYKATGLSIGGVYYGYYYSSENEWLLPDFYGGNDLENLTTVRIGALLKRFLITGTIMSCTGRKTRATHTFGRSSPNYTPFSRSFA